MLLEFVASFPASPCVGYADSNSAKGPRIPSVGPRGALQLLQNVVDVTLDARPESDLRYHNGCEGLILDARLRHTP